ncbi:MAG: hypothetical protein QXP96_04905 [Thermoproteota archaeon]
MELEGKIKEIIKEFIEKLNELEEEKKELIREKSDEIREDPIVELEIFDKYANLINNLQEEYIEKLGEMLDEVGLEFSDDRRTLIVGSKIVNDHVKIFYYDTYAEEIETEVVPLIDEEKTPFTYAVSVNMPWEYVRPIWYTNIHNIINELAEAELSGKLDEKLDEIINRLEAGIWVYEYRHLLNTIRKVINQ